MKKVLLILVCNMLVFSALYANDIQTLKDRVKAKYISTLPYNKEHIIIESYNIKTSKKDFILLILSNWQDDELGRAVERYSCVDIFGNIKTLQSFCFSNSVGKVENKKDFFTITSLWQDRIGNIANTYLTFRLINGKFYLHQYSREEGYVDDAKDKEVIDKTYIYYRQARDDSKKENLIPLESVNDELLQKLELKYNAKY
ncbi:hypothetical protein [Helicobacter sp. MIT 05-5294]|uniref:hypothetical protein n=1 Tax=Helicobacter sp. MIT 05-5294 TaxID=1548150 RepID=UPI001EE900E5|nr:hypothetical protein [Helicobacter sp. MIT 05-5294]